MTGRRRYSASAAAATTSTSTSTIPLVLSLALGCAWTLYATLTSVRISNNRVLFPFPDQVVATAVVTTITAAATTANPTDLYEGIPTGVLSTRDASFFRALQNKVDSMNDTERCARYGWTFDPQQLRQQQRRRIFFGALVAGEPWEVWHIAAAETYGLYSGMVLVEANRTQNLTPRKLRQLHHAPLIASLFGIDANNVQVRAFVDEKETTYHNSNSKHNTNNKRSELHNLDREHLQREEILKGWHALGMQPNDIGFLADADETFTRDLLRAVQVCDNIPEFNYAHHQCRHERVKLLAVTRIFEGSPECITHNRQGWHPELMIGHCLTHIGDAQRHPPAPRSGDSMLRATGFGRNCNDWEGEQNITDGRYPLWNAADFRRTCGGTQVRVLEVPQSPAAGSDGGSKQPTTTSPPLEPYTAFHFHNFVAQLNHTRFKYQTYGHANPLAMQRPIYDISDDLRLMYQCAVATQNASSLSVSSTAAAAEKDTPSQPLYTHVSGGFQAAQSFLPLYFYDAEYRQRRHAHVQAMIQAEEVK